MPSTYCLQHSDNSLLLGMVLKKTSKDYGQFYFRIDESEKEDLETELLEVLDYLQKKTNPNELKPKRNDLILRALRRGLKIIKRETLKLDVE